MKATVVFDWGGGLRSFCLNNCSFLLSCSLNSLIDTLNWSTSGCAQHMFVFVTVVHQMRLAGHVSHCWMKKFQRCGALQQFIREAKKCFSDIPDFSMCRQLFSLSFRSLLVELVSNIPDKKRLAGPSNLLKRSRNSHFPLKLPSPIINNFLFACFFNVHDFLLRFWRREVPLKLKVMSFSQARKSFFFWSCFNISRGSFPDTIKLIPQQEDRCQKFEWMIQ